jgi:hypothetical protein
MERPSETIVWRSARPWESCDDETKERSIFKTSTGNWRRYESEEYPVPKSSIAIRTPRDLSRSRCLIASSASSMSTLSVTSMVR